MNNWIQWVSHSFCNIFQELQNYPATSVINVTRRFQKKFSQNTRCLTVAASTRIKHCINQTVVSSLANLSVSRLVMFLDLQAKSLQINVFFIICTFVSLMCIKKKTKKIQQSRSIDLFSTKWIRMGTIISNIWEWSIFCRYKGKEINNPAKIFAITKTKEPDEIVCMCLNSNLSEFPSGQTGWCISANPKVITPITYGGEMRHTVPL